MEVPPAEDFKEKDSLFELKIEFDALRVFVPSLELLACCKIFSVREKDLIDLEETTILEHCNKEKLLGMVDEYKRFLLNPNQIDLNLHELPRIFKGKKI